jgi:hypothetical protein
MPSEDMGSIPGFKENYQHALEEKLGIISIRALAEADEGVMYTALRRTHATKAQIANWQAAARGKLSETVTEKPDWHDAARFAVNLTRRQVNGKWEPWLTVEQAERGPEAPHREWPSWESTALGPWMRSQVDRPEDQADPEAGAMGSISTASGAEAATAVPAQAGTKLRIDSVTLTDAVHERRLIRDGNHSGESGEDLTPPVRLELTVSGARSGRQVWAAVWFPRQAEPGWSPHEPVVVPSSGQTEFDLSSVPPGEHKVRLLTWASSPDATLTGVTLPKLSFRPADSEDDPAVTHPA